MSVNDWKAAVCDTREAYEHHCDISFSQESDASTDLIAALEGLCAAYETERVETKAIAAALARISATPDIAVCRMDEMERQDPNPDDGAIEVGVLKEPWLALAGRT